ncbi:MAG TPA: long-chain fatty acid--CoA ligase [Dehalococcoidia bacterium]|nr:long-chain fatty acid--CoA ligase [Dehalococcoidia bacterium]
MAANHAYPWYDLHPAGYPFDCTAREPTGLAAFRASVSRGSHRPAIHYFDETLTFAEVDRASDALAAALHDMGVGRGGRVVVQLQNIPAFPISVFAAWKLGAAVVPLNPMYRERELSFYCRDSGASVFITMESSAEEAKKAAAGTDVNCLITAAELDFLDRTVPLPAVLHGARRTRVDGTADFRALLARYDGRRPPFVDPSPDDVAYITYTSGTTGPPKGALNTHANLAYACTAFVLAYRMSSDDVVLALAPFIHVTGSSCLLAVATLVGAPIVAAFRYDPAEILRLIEKWRVTYTNGPLTAYIGLLNHPDIRRRDLSSLVKTLCGGAPVAPGVAREYEETTGNYMHNTYGLTETTSPGIITPLGARSPVDAETGALSVGFPPPGSVAKIVDLETGNDLESGRVGEIVIKGPSVVPGYWQRPAETANAIHDGWLFTGDVGKMTPEGWFYVVDRKKDLINVSGFKVWPREVEDVLYQHPAVAGACVIGVPDDYRGETVKAFVTLKPGHENATPDDFIHFCRERMAAYKYPRSVEVVDEIPKTITGKMLRRQLREQAACDKG